MTQVRIGHDDGERIYACNPETGEEHDYGFTVADKFLGDVRWSLTYDDVHVRWWVICYGPPIELLGYEKSRELEALELFKYGTSETFQSASPDRRVIYGGAAQTPQGTL